MISPIIINVMYSILTIEIKGQNNNNKKKTGNWAEIKQRIYKPFILFLEHFSFGFCLLYVPATCKCIYTEWNGLESDLFQEEYLLSVSHMFKSWGWSLSLSYICIVLNALDQSFTEISRHYFNITIISTSWKESSYLLKLYN